MKPLILLEFNELCEPLIDRWIEEGELPNFKKLRSKSQLYKTIADAEPPALEPWIQWYSMHTGLTYAEHKVFSLTEGQKQSHSDVWGELQAAGLSTFNCGSMNAKESAVDGSTYIPDPWCTKSKPFPESISSYSDFVSEQVQNQSARKGIFSKLKLTMNFIAFMFKNGLSIQTLMKVTSQLVNEKIHNRDLYWKRAFILDWFQVDLFESIFKKQKPDFSTFFINSTAHTQHSYWRFLEPEKFNVDIDSKEYKQHKDNIFEAYKNMDMIIERFFDCVGDTATIALATGLSQKAFIKDGDYQIYYRLNDVDSFVKSLGFKDYEIYPVMTHQYIFKSSRKDNMIAFKNILDTAVFENRSKVFDYRVKEDGSVYFGTYITNEIQEFESVLINKLTFDFGKLFYKINESKSGCHNPEGTFWIITEQESKRCPDLPITSVNGVIKEYFQLT